MGMIALPQRHLVLPQYAAPIDRAGLGKGAAILLNPGAGLRDIAAQRDWSLSGTAGIRAGALGKTLYFDQADTSYAGLSSPDISNAAGTLAIFAARIGASDSFGHVWFSTSTGNNKYYHIYNSENQIDWGVGGGSTTFSLVGKIFNTVNTSLIFTTNGTGSAGKAFYFNGVATGTPDATAPAVFSAGSNSLVFGKYWGGTSWNVDADVLVMAYLPGVFWGAVEAKAFHDSKGGALFKAPARRIYIASSSSSGAGSASGTSTVSGVGASVNAQPGTSAGTSTASGVGASTAASVGSASGSASASGTGAADANSVGSSSGVATVSGVGTTSTGSSGSAAGTSTASGVGSSVAESVGSSSGVGTASGVGSSIAESSGSSSGSASVSAVGDYSVAGSSVGTASGASTVSGVGASVVSAVGTSSGTSSVLGVSDSGSPEREAGGDDYPLIVREKRRKKTLAEQPNKHLESIFEKAVKDVLGEKYAPAPSLKEIIELEKKQPVLAPATKPDSNSVEFDVIKDEEAEKVAALLAQYQEHVRLAGMHEDEELMILLMEAF